MLYLYNEQWKLFDIVTDYTGETNNYKLMSVDIVHNKME